LHRHISAISTFISDSHFTPYSHYWCIADTEPLPFITTTHYHYCHFTPIDNMAATAALGLCRRSYIGCITQYYTIYYTSFIAIYYVILLSFLAAIIYTLRPLFRHSLLNITTLNTDITLPHWFHSIDYYWYFTFWLIAIHYIIFNTPLSLLATEYSFIDITLILHTMP